MTLITMNCEEMTIDLKEDCASYLRIASINVHVMMMRKKDMITIKNLDVSPLYVYQEDFVACMLDSVLQRVTVHKTAKIFYNCEKTTVKGVGSGSWDVDAWRANGCTSSIGTSKYR